MNEVDVNLRLDEDFLFILSFAKDYMNTFVDNPQANALSQQWLNKLCIEVVGGLAAKRIRNTYLVQLMSCMQLGKLISPFDSPPSPGPLAPLSIIDKIEPEPSWLEELVQEAKEQQLGVSHAKDARTYLATKVFEENKGACAYLAVSVADEGDIPTWIRMGTAEESDILDKHLEQIFKNVDESGPKQSTKTKKDDKQFFNKDLAKYLIDLVQMELSGKSRIGQHIEIEDMIERFTNAIQGTPLGQHASTLSGSQLRKFLLTHVQSILQNELASLGG